jgi:hypothetical protein
MAFVSQRPESTFMPPPKKGYWWVSGFADAEGCFSVSVFKNNTCKLGWQTQPSFDLGLHIKDI